jgi:hypothetical protein
VPLGSGRWGQVRWGQVKQDQMVVGLGQVTLDIVRFDQIRSDFIKSFQLRCCTAVHFLFQDKLIATIYYFLLLLGACKRLYRRLCWLVGLLVRWLVRPLVGLSPYHFECIFLSRLWMD